MPLVVNELPGVLNEGRILEPDAPAETPAEDRGVVDDRVQLVLPGPGREISMFASEVGEIMAPKQIWIVQGGRVVELREVSFGKKVKSIVFHALTAVECRSCIEEHLQTGYMRKDKENDERLFSPQSMSTETAAALLSSPQLKRELPVIERILDVPIPFIHEGQIVFANRGYDERLNSYCRPDVPEITDMSLDEAKDWLRQLQQEFCFANPLSVTLSTARLLTPMCRGLMGWDARPPVWVFEGNRPRAGKDYLAGCTSLVYEGRVNEDTPLETEGEETKKRIASALQSGRRFMHFANCQGFIHNSAFEHAATAKVVSFRALGKNDASADMTLPNEIEFSVSANTGFGFTEDFSLRCRKISLQYSEEDANSRKFTRSDLHGWILENRSNVLSALAALIRHWDQAGRPPGATPFTSFPEWARVVGGIVSCSGLGDPCSQQTGNTMTGDWVTDEMKKLFQEAYQEHPDKWLLKRNLYDLINQPGERELFSQLDLKERKGQTTFGLKLKAFKGRILAGIQMLVNDDDSSRPKFMFTKRLQAADKAIVANVFGAEADKKCEPCKPCEPLPPDYKRDSFLPVCNAGGQRAANVREVHKVRTTTTDSLPDCALDTGAESDASNENDDEGPPKPPACIFLNPPAEHLRTRLYRDVLEESRLVTAQN